MPSSALPQLKDWLLIRHSSSRKHGDFSSVESQIEMPFESGSTSSSSSGFSEWTRPGDRWVVVGQLPKRSWAAVYSNQENEDLFEHFCKRRRLEVLWIKSQPDGFSIKIVKEKRETLNWGSVNDGVVTAKCSDDKLLVLLNGCKGRDDVLKVVCSNFEVPRKMPDVIEQDGEFQLIGTSGRPVKTGMKNLVLFNGSGLAEGENDASELLSDAIDSCDIDKLKQAIEMGADLEVLPERSISPLTHALFRCGYQKNWQKCAQALIDAGSRVDGRPGDMPPIVSACWSVIDPDISEQLIEFLIRNGADVNLVHLSESALGRSAIRAHEKAVTLLLEAGADPKTSLAFKDRPLISFVKEKFDEEVAHGRENEFASILELLTGEKVEVPILTVDPELMQEAMHMRQMQLERELVVLLNSLLDPEVRKSNRTQKLDGFESMKSQLEEVGFVESGNLSAFNDELAAAVLLESGCGETALDVAKLSALVNLVVFTHTDLNFDAFISADSHGETGLRTDVVCQSKDEFFLVCNRPFLDLPQSPKRTDIPGGSAKQLVDEMQKLIAGRELLDAPAESASERIKLFLQRTRAESLEELAEKTARTIGDSALPRYERVGQYFELWDVRKYPNMTVRTIADHRLEDLSEEIKSEDPFRMSRRFVSVADLLLIQHLELKGQVPRKDYLEKGLETVRRFTEYFSDHPETDPHEGQGFCYLLFVWLIGLLAGEEKDWQLLCEFPKSSLTRCRGFYDMPKQPELAKVLLLIASRDRKRAVSGSKLFASQIRKGKDTQAKRLLELWQSVEANDETGLEKCLIRSVEQTKKLLTKQKSKKLSYMDLRSQQHSYRRMAWVESVICLLAKRQGMRIPDLPIEISDWLLIE